MPRTDMILFLDLETTGSEVEHDEIVEIGATLISVPDLTEISSYTAVVNPSDQAWERMLDNDVVFNMHYGNGLLLDITDGTRAPVDYYDRKMTEWLNDNAHGSEHVPFGGSGVLHFDRPFINKFMPRLAKRITYWAYDVGPVRRTYELFGGKGWPSPSDKTHRALADARFHAEEFRFARYVLEMSMRDMQ